MMATGEHAPTAFAARIRTAEVEFQAGRDVEGLRLINALTASEPTNAWLWHQAAGLAGRNDRSMEAIGFAMSAALLAPGRIEYRLGLATALHRSGDLALAISQYELIAATAPDDSRSLIGLASALTAVGLLDDAARTYRIVLTMDPDNAGARAGAEIASARRGQASSGVSREVAQRRFEEAARLQAAGRAREALEHFMHLAQSLPGAAAIHYRIGGLLQDLGQAEDARAHYDLAARLQPDWFAAAHNAGKLAASLGLADHARRSLGQAHRLRPQDGISMRLVLLTDAIHESASAIEAARARFDEGLERVLAAPPRIEDPLNKTDLPTFYLAYHGLCNRALNSKLARAFAATVPDLSWRAPHCLASTRRPGRIRIGFLSQFLRTHSIGKVARGLVAELDRERFEVYVLNVPPVSLDQTANWIREHCDHWLILADSLPEARTQIAALELDVLFYQDIGMEPFSYLLAFARLARVQCVSYGHPDTTGIPNMDYYISNDLYEPPGAAEHYSERLIQLHDLPTLAYYFRPPVPQPLPTRAELGLPVDAHLYLCPQTLFKLHPDFDALMKGILERDGAGRIVLFSGHCTEWSVRLQKRLERSMGPLAERIQFLPRQAYPRFLQLLSVADVVIDTLHFNGMNTSLDAFAVGTPVITLPTALQRGRFTQAMYQSMEIDDGVARDEEDYANRAVQIVRDADRRHALRELIRERSHRLFEDRRAVAQFERFFLEAHCRSMGIAV